MTDADEMLKYYGVVVPEKKFHISPLCPSLRTLSNWKQGEVNQYAQESDAIIMGHLKRCPVCFNMYRFQIKIEDKVYEYLLDKYDLNVLTGMAEMQKKGGTITVIGIGNYSGMSPQDTNDTIKRLRKLRLVAGAGFNGLERERGKRKFTAMGAAVVLAYTLGYYGPPLSEQSDQPIAFDKINRQL